MAKRMLIDASQPEETRVAVVSGTRIEEFDFESSTKKQITGNIYLAKIIRVEPSLQAAFVEYGGNRHGFLAFSEIHPDYYQIPTADRQALLAHHAAATRKSAESYDDERPQRQISSKARPVDDDDHQGDQGADDQPRHDHDDGAPTDHLTSESDAEHNHNDHGHDHHTHDDHDHGGEPEPNHGDGQADAAQAGEAPAHSAPAQAEFGLDGDAATSAQEDSDRLTETDGETSQADGDQDSDGDSDQEAETARGGDDDRGRGRNRRGRRRRGPDTADGDDAPQEVESLGGDDSFDDMPRPRFHGGRPYKIQEVIKRRQIILVQVVKEERGTKGAALTTYLSLAGRYCVLMPNTGRGGGISRKITNAVDRKRLKAIATDLDVPEGMGLIVRTAGANRTKVEIKRDFEYLLRLWENVRETTLKSVAPALILEEGSLIKRAIRDLYSKDIESVQVAGEEGYREAKEFMRMLMPSHAKNVQAYREPVPLFLRTQVETQLDQLFSPQVQLKSGGYLVIDQTEALVAIDVNSGRSTREHNIEDTALKTNLEAADEVARQLRLRDLAGLIVVDFIDMEDPRNNRAVERRLKDALKADRARIQVGRISAFGLLEMSRQRLRSSVMEISSNSCPMCNGAGVVRSVESTALHVIRGIEEEGLNGRSAQIVVRLPHPIAMFLLNQKRDTLRRVEDRYGFQVIVEIDHGLIPPDYKIERFGIRIERPDLIEMRKPQPVIEEEPEEPIVDSVDDEDEGAETEGAARESRAERPPSERHERRPENETEEGKRRRRRRRRRRGRRDDEGQETGENQIATDADGDGPDEGEDDRGDQAAARDGSAPPPHGDGDAEGRRRRRSRRGGRRQRGEDPVAGFIAGDQPDVPPDAWAIAPAPAAPLPRSVPIEEVKAPELSPEPSTAAAPEPAPVAEAPPSPPPAPVIIVPEADEPPAGPPRKGWWRKTFSL